MSSSALLLLLPLSAWAHGVSQATAPHRAAPPQREAQARLLQLRGGSQTLESMAEFEGLRANESRLLVLDFTAQWCGPCQRIAPAYAAMAEEFADSALLAWTRVGSAAPTSPRSERLGEASRAADRSVCVCAPSRAQPLSRKTWPRRPGAGSRGLRLGLREQSLGRCGPRNRRPLSL